ncbi:NAD(P)-binding protein [Daldinia vernicosa]|uniref:NAD(P)-binding protein n=1 Tax=Daldinia vernicosa TaxID=114800 RepID=UPI002008A594|nr:NAD(P)-binding protein [Daldinia vernicosa]KAI0847630.1 NAD(P)-binding protein [Daldinia vernicosa]
MSKPWILVSPASRGIGHALTRHLLRTTTAPILATARADLPGLRTSILDNLYTSSSSSPPESVGDKDEASASAAAKRLHVARVDVTDESTLRSASLEASRLFPPETHHLRLAFALPGILLHPEKSPQDIDYARALHTFQTNTLGPLLLIKHFSTFLPRKSVAISPEPLFLSSSVRSPNHATWLTASARVGSTADNRLGGWYTYRASKAAVNSLTKTFDNHLRVRCADAAGAIAYHPGTVRTGLSREYWDRVPAGQLFTPEYAAERMLEVVRTREISEDRGRCWDHRGDEILP